MCTYQTVHGALRGELKQRTAASVATVHQRWVHRCESLEGTEVGRCDQRSGVPDNRRSSVKLGFVAACTGIYLGMMDGGVEVIVVNIDGPLPIRKHGEDVQASKLALPFWGNATSAFALGGVGSTVPVVGPG